MDTDLTCRAIIIIIIMDNSTSMAANKKFSTMNEFKTTRLCRNGESSLIYSEKVKISSVAMIANDREHRTRRKRKQSVIIHIIIYIYKATKAFYIEYHNYGPKAKTIYVFNIYINDSGVARRKMVTRPHTDYTTGLIVVRLCKTA